MSGFNFFLNFLGENCEKFFKWIGRIFAAIYHFIVRGLKFIKNKIKSLFEKLRTDSVKSFNEDLGQFRSEVHSVRSNIANTAKHAPLSLPSVLFHYIKKSFSRYPHMFRKMANVVLPVLACIILIITINYWSKVTFALSVECNGQELGYIADESVYQEAQNLVEERLDTTGDDDSTRKLLSQADYKVVIVSPSELTDAQTISDRIVETSDEEITQACGIYIDGDFLCAVRNEMDAVQVFDNIKDQYETSDPDEVIGFVEDISYVQGLYNESSIWDTEQLQKKLGTKKEEAVYYTVKAGDTLSGIAESFDIKTSTLISLNPDSEDVIYEGEKLLVSQEVNYVRIKVVKTVVSEEETDFNVVKTNNSNMYSGTTKVTQAGQTGLDRVTKLVTYVDGIQVSTEEINRETIRNPVDKKIDVGTKSTYVSGNYAYSVTVKGSMVWPLVGCYTISSPFGYRNGGFHSGIDISNGRCYGNLVLAAASGTVTTASNSGNGYGNYIVINHGGGLVTLYGHLSSISVSVGQYVNAGDAIGRCGSSGRSTGPHLHFEVRVNGTAVNPAPYIGA